MFFHSTRTTPDSSGDNLQAIHLCGVYMSVFLLYMCNVGIKFDNVTYCIDSITGCLFYSSKYMCMCTLYSIPRKKANSYALSWY